ncbi:hypothetical protein SZ25_00748 [Candidatus Arcanobacter lacustris]|uniref:Uncharacterized protein n=1 Tax=Candidatus Arcanibacter lacustris TaxID=1607817 RepID=A0A0F5MMZ3_9RICK|nr:hypothetical protein SZ25_00748 [Candidatus Arcanobacter lacustris]
MKFSFEVKRTYIQFAILAVVIYGIMYLWVWSSEPRLRYKKSSNLACAVEWALGKPNYDNKPASDLIKQKAILKISDEEWNKEACDLVINPTDEAFNKACQYDEQGNVSGTYNGKPCPPSRMKLSKCADIFSGKPTPEYPTDYAVHYCSMLSANNCAVIAVNEYILKRPDILEAVIYAAEHPCQFVPTIKEYCEEWEKPLNECPNYNQSTYGKVWNGLSCGSEVKPKDKVIIVFEDKRRNEKFHIITKRKE